MAVSRETHLRFGYAFPDETNPGQILFYFGDGEIPNEAFDVTGSSARLAISTPPTLPVTRCVITGVVGEPGAITCALSDVPVTLDLTWAADGYGTVHQTDSTVDTAGSTTTASHRQFNQVTARMTGTWSETTGHAASAYPLLPNPTTIQARRPWSPLTTTRRAWIWAVGWQPMLDCT